MSLKNCRCLSLDFCEFISLISANLRLMSVRSFRVFPFHFNLNSFSGDEVGPTNSHFSKCLIIFYFASKRTSHISLVQTTQKKGFTTGPPRGAFNVSKKQLKFKRYFRFLARLFFPCQIRVTQKSQDKIRSAEGRLFRPFLSLFRLEEEQKKPKKGC